LRQRRMGQRMKVALRRRRRRSPRVRRWKRGKNYWKRRQRTMRGCPRRGARNRRKQRRRGSEEKNKTQRNRRRREQDCSERSRDSMSRDWHTIFRFAVVGLVVAAMFCAFFKTDSLAESWAAAWMSWASLVICPGYFVFILAVAGGELPIPDSALVWVIIGLSN